MEHQRIHNMLDFSSLKHTVFGFFSILFYSLYTVPMQTLKLFSHPNVCFSDVSVLQTLYKNMSVAW